jgi:RHS repeat-associated protein
MMIEGAADADLNHGGKGVQSETMKIRAQELGLETRVWGSQPLTDIAPSVLGFQDFDCTGGSPDLDEDSRQATGSVRFLIEPLTQAILATYDAGTGLRLFNYNQNPQKLDEVFSYKTAQGTKYYPHTDMLGSVYAVSDSTGTSQASWSYDVYGTKTQTSGTLVYAFGFTGREHDGDTGRYYDPSVGAFLSPDRWQGDTRQALLSLGSTLPTPALTPHDFARSYEYVLDRPTVFNDPTGFYAATATVLQGTAGGILALQGAFVDIVGYCPFGGEEVYDARYILVGFEWGIPFPIPGTLTAFQIALTSENPTARPQATDAAGYGFQTSIGFSIVAGASISWWEFGIGGDNELYTDLSKGLSGLIGSEVGFDISAGGGFFVMFGPFNVDYP